MRITLIGTILLFSALARCQRRLRKSVPACVTDCQKSLAEHGLLTDGMESTCATPKLQRAHFQCLINLCSPENYGRALAHSVSACCDTGVNIIPLHPIEITQPLGHKRSRQPEMSDKSRNGDESTAFKQEFDLAGNFAVALTCNTGQDGIVTVSLGSPQASIASASMADDVDLFSVNGFKTSECAFVCPRQGIQGACPVNTPGTAVLPNGPATTSVDKAILMDESRSLGNGFTTDCESSSGGQLTTSVTTTTQAQSTPCKSNVSAFGSTPTSTVSGSFRHDASTTSQTYPSSSCTSSSASTFEDSQGPVQMISSTESGFQTLEHTTSGCTSSSSLTRAESQNWPSHNPNTPTTDCSDGVGRSSTSTRLQTSSHESWTLDSDHWSTSRLLSSDTPCPSDLAVSRGLSSQSFTLTSALSQDRIRSTSCADSSQSSSSLSAHSSSTSCSASTRAETARDRFETASTTNTMSCTTSSTFTTSSSPEGSLAATLAAYTFSSPLSLPPAYSPLLEEYGYGTPPPVYGFPSQGNGVDEPQSSGTSYPTSSLDQNSSFGSGRQNGNPAAYGASRTRPTQMAHAAPAHATNTDHDETKLHDISNQVEVTLVSSVFGEGLQTTIITINQAQPTSLTMASALALNSPADGKPSSNTSEEGSRSINRSSGPRDEFNNSSSVGFETPMPAMLVGGSVTTDPSIYVLISTVFLAAGFAICIL